MKKMLITGVTGFVGSNLVRKLVSQGFAVKALIRKGANLKPVEGLNIEFFCADIRDKESLLKAIKGCNIVFHVAAYYTLWALNEKEIYQINVDGTHNIMDAALQEGIDKVVYTSTAGTIGKKFNDENADEDTIFNLWDISSAYKRSKYLAELEAYKYFQKGLPVIIVNPTLPIGAGDHKPTPTGKIIVDFLNQKIPCYFSGGLNFISVQDVVEGHMLALQKGQCGEKYILGNVNMEMKDFFLMMEELTGIPSPTKKIPYPIALCLAHLSEFISDHITYRHPLITVSGLKLHHLGMYYDCSKAVTELGLPQTSIKEALNEAVNWYYQNGYITNPKSIEILRRAFNGKNCYH